MNEDDENNGSNKQKKKEDLYVLKEEMFVGKSSYESYMHYHHEKSSCSKEEYFRLCRTIEHGKELLPSESKEFDAINLLYNDACEVLKNEILKKPSQKFGWQDPASKSHPSYTITAIDGGEITCLPTEYTDAISFFIETQYSSHITKLRDIDNRIYHFLTKYEIISKKPSVDEMIDEQIKKAILSDEGK